ncbi:MAG TPA: Asp-tRNA(Asn)/Glu-tRNA(Gln) amidotransferase subunit GatA [Candidatus Saccharimonadales bacterium]|nr:Asp-tRNA(Asn)/Glu-tRNA(Gln) amidotransferase subunit GatA [Candidatus Saccharimonadales bacterium]
MSDLRRPLAELVAEVHSGKLSATQLVTASLEAIKQHEDYHAVLEVSEAALARAKAVDAQIKAGKDVGRLAGIPFIAKDNFLTHQTHTTAASNMLKPFKAPYQATAIEKLEAEGAIMVAKANLDAFAHGSSTENSDFGPTKNPVDPTRVPGGSSGGSAAAVALGLACFATGTDTGSSIRLPASFCGVVGMMPSYGLISRYGVVAMGSSFDTIGAMTNHTADMSLLIDIMADKDPKDATTVERAKSYVDNLDSDLKGKKIGLVKEYLGEGTDPGVKQVILAAVDKMKQAGAEVIDVSLPSAVELALASYYILIPAEVSSNLARYDGIRYGYSTADAKTLADTYLRSRDEGFGAEAKRRILIGTYVLSSGYYDAYYKQAQKVRTLLIREFEAVFKDVDLLVGPNAPMPAFKLGERTQDPLQMYLADICTVAVNLVGSTAISVPAGETQGLPVGVQLIAPQRGERALLGAAKAVEALLGAAV